MTLLYKRIKSNGLFLALLAGALLLHLLLRLELARRGFVAVSADEFARGIGSGMWASNPTLELRHFASPWLPSEMYMNGLLLRIWPNPFWIPRLTVFAFSCLTLFSFVWLNFLLFESRLAAVANAYLLVLFHWFAWLSATPMLEMYYLPFYILGLAFLVRLIKGQGRYAWLWGGLSLLVATSFHVQSWLIIAATLLGTLPFSLPALYKKEWEDSQKWIGFYLISVSFVAFALFAQWRADGAILGFVSQHTTYSLWFYNGYDVAVQEKLLYYPRIVLSQTPQIILLLSIFAIWSLLQEKGSRLRFAPLLLAVFILAIFSYSNVNSGPPSAAPNRYSMLHTGILILYAAYGFKQFVSVPIDGNQVKRLGIIALALVMLLLVSRQQYTRILNFPKGMPSEPLAAGSAMKELMQNDDGGKIMLELLYWEFLAVEMMINSAESVVYDRERILGQHDLPSELAELESEQAYQQYLQENQIEYFVLYSPELISTIEAADTTLRWQGEQWRIYSVNSP